ncbi:MAG: hypothetical protein LKE88_11675 [Acidaminococcus provencensis]|uniref:phage tail terminator family protein n=1 Tax=Acidaminococcus provencensis TaxID=2058289 RepID=UPI0023F51C0C|nr:hypothetical protein [Acidaminococcus provencensis]MCH4097274.1 hypothetical protein [Acidaminococcus provencensis]
MTTELINELARKLHSIRAYPVYVDEIKNKVQFPCWRIKLLDDASVKLVVGDRYQQEATFDVWMILNERGEIDDIRGQVIALAESLMYELELISLEDGTKVRGSDLHYRITDGVLHVFVTYATFTRRIKPAGDVMEHLDVSGKAKG